MIQWQYRLAWAKWPGWAIRLDIESARHMWPAIGLFVQPGYARHRTLRWLNFKISVVRDTMRYYARPDSIKVVRVDWNYFDWVRWTKRQ